MVDPGLPTSPIKNNNVNYAIYYIKKHVLRQIKKEPKTFDSQEHETGFEPAALALARRCSTTEPLVHIKLGEHPRFADFVSCFASQNQTSTMFEAGDGNRTHVSSLEG